VLLSFAIHPGRHSKLCGRRTEGQSLSEQGAGKSCNGKFQERSTMDELHDDSSLLDDGRLRCRHSILKHVSPPALWLSILSHFHGPPCEVSEIPVFQELLRAASALAGEGLIENQVECPITDILLTKTKPTQTHLKCRCKSSPQPLPCIRFM
jgi:hypothetical protein